ncbi:MAG: DUF58 domain-containing protein, partial [Halobaculum sp.]
MTDSSGDGSGREDEWSWVGDEDADAAGDSDGAVATGDDGNEAVSTSDDSRVSPTVVSRQDTGSRWTVWLGGALGLTGLGLSYGSPLLIAAAVVPLAYVGYGALSALPSSVDLRLERSVQDSQTTPGDPVSVTLSVTNAGDAVLTDLRVVDGVPGELAVGEGSPRAAVALRPGETATVEYEVIAKRGSFGFDDARVRVRSMAGAAAASLSVPVAGVSEVSCTAPAAAVPVERAAPLRVGTATADSGGEGLEFYSTREYRPGDPRSRINWRQFAKRGELVTTEFREERAGRAVVLVDVRPPTRRSATAAFPTGAEFAAYTAEVAVDRLAADGDELSLAVLGLDTERVSMPVETVGEAVWVDSAHAGDGKRRARATLEAAAEAARERVPDPHETPGFDSHPPRGADAAAATLAARAPADAHVILVSPFADTTPSAYARRFAVEGSAVTVVAPDHTASETLGGRTATLHRDLRLRSVEPFCRAVVDWPADQPLGLAVARALSVRSRRR